MLDKSIEFKNIIMKLENENVRNIDTPALPEGFSFRFFKNEDDIKHWARIETSVLEFENEPDAEDYFIKAYLPYLNDLKQRCLFIENQEGIPIATTMAWFSDSELGHQAALHWVSVDPRYQGLGLGKSIVLKALSLFQELEPNQSIWLHTQTWSHPAVCLYHKLGFNVVKKDLIATMNTRNGKGKIYPNDFEEAMVVLKKVMDEADVLKLFTSAV